ncbi:MAG: mechanosensitive ion channel [Gammaproteobacteria bacterium]|nr:mechanosensitive ion channel [Gammaproteobacteria bacterium]
MEDLINASVLGEYMIPWGINILMAIAVYVIGRWIAKLVVKSVDKLMARSDVDESLRKFSGGIINAALTIVVIIASLEQLGVDTTSVLAVFAAAGLAVGLALKDSLSNFAAGVMLIIFKPFKVGEVINAAGVTGSVEAIRIFNTLMRTGDNQEITVPNSHIYGGTIINLTTRDTRRIDLVIGIGYDDNIGKARALLEDILSNDPAILKDPTPIIMVLELGDSSVDLAVRPWVRTSDYWTVRSDLLQTIKETFDNNGISIPFPQRDLHVFEQSKSAQAA